MIFASPPWGGPGYEMLSKYTLDHLSPKIEDLLRKSLEFTSNLILFLPKNTSIQNII